jgi:MFS family permease
MADRFGPHRVLALAALSWGVLTVVMGCVQKQVGGVSMNSGLVVVLARFLLGICEACAYPTFNRALANWMRRSERAFSSGLIHCGSGLGGAFTPVFIALTVQHLGWRESFWLSGVITFGVAILWWKASTDHPAQHRRVNEAELRSIRSEREEIQIESADRQWYRSLARSQNAYMLCASEFLYGLSGFVYLTWFYIYFVKVRGAGDLYSAVLSSLTYLAMAVGAPVGGILCDLCVKKRGSPWGRRTVPLVSISLSGVLGMIAPMIANNTFSAVVFSVAAGLQFVAASAFWATVIDITRRGTGVLGGFMNGTGNLGSAIGTIVFPWLVDRLGWQLALQVAGSAGVASGLIWMFIDSSRQIDVVRFPAAVLRSEKSAFQPGMD